MIGDYGQAIAGGILAALVSTTPAFAGDNTSGLWVGNAHVSHVQAPNGEMQPSPAPFTFRVIIHVNDDGSATLVNQAVVVRSPQRVVVLTGSGVSLARLSALSDAELSGAEKFASAGYDMDGGSAQLSGTFGDQTPLRTTLSIGAESDTNPFRHRFHPDHDNLSNDGAPLQDDAEVYALTRAMAFAFNPALASERRVGGTFSETISGMRAKPIEVSGLFALEQVYVAPASEQGDE